MANKIKNILFDFDGTLFDTQKLGANVESTLLRKEGIIISPEEITKIYSGAKTNEFFTELLGDRELANKLVNQKWITLFEKCNLAEEMADLYKLFSFLESNGVLFSIGTASPKKWVDDILREKRLTHFFSEGSIIGGDMVKNGKPNKETWVRLQRNILAKNCLVVEDEVSGCIAALSAGMQCVVLGEQNKRFPNEVSYIKSLDEIIDYII